MDTSPHIHPFSCIAEELARGRDICLATMIRQKGSSPRKPGTRLLVHADGRIEGSIGGGALEAAVMKAARRARTGREALLVSYGLEGKDAAESAMICGGKVEVYVEPFFSGDEEARFLFQAAADAWRRRRTVVMATCLRPGLMERVHGRKLLLLDGGEEVGVLDIPEDRKTGMIAELCRILEEARTGVWVRDVPGRSESYLVECIGNPPTVYLFGGGHIAFHLADLVKKVGFDLVVVDDRDTFANPERFPGADGVWIHPFHRLPEKMRFGPDTYVVVATRSHVHDRELLAQLLDKETAYLGMVGSRRKKSLLFKALEQEGAKPSQLDRVHCPIGLDIGAETPEEIAVSIVAELIAVRARNRSA